MDMDSYWQKYETELPRALNLLAEEAAVPLWIWLRVLVPHVAATFVRGREFLKRYTNRLKNMGYTHYVNPVGAMTMELQRRLAPVAGSRWIVFHASPSMPFVNNDLGMCGLFDLRIQQRGWIYPIDSFTALGIFPVDRRRVARWDGSTWTAIIEHTHDSYNFGGMNQNIASWASEFIFGRAGQLVERFAGGLRDRSTTDGMFGWPFSSKELRFTEFSWHRLTAATHADPQPSDLRIEEVMGSAEAAQALAAGWVPPMIFPVNQTPDLEFESLEATGNTISLQLTRAPRRWGDYSGPQSVAG
ncbi:MAG: hypothetical protein EPN48_07840 [Microbacteriaceae bacterium]|nr:MAG: hypothetical protein EPN48_07840 [Microbacteriaceae bacterium]